MIIVKLEGGHSNQLFQYAAGRRLAHKLGAELYMDKYWFKAVVEGDTNRYYELGDYKFEQKFIDRQRFALVENNPDNYKARLYNLIKGKAKPRIKNYRQSGNYFDKKVLSLPDNTYLDGWWQDERYFKDIRPLLLREIELKKPASGRNEVWLKQIKNSHSVSLHIRRGDYVTNAMTKKFHGLLSIEYYRKAIKFLQKKTDLKEFQLFVFSNDIEWCKQNLDLGFPTTFVKGNKKGSEDMRLMKHCKHNILANSSFSWWGAWLNQNAHKIVIAPKLWFQDKKANQETDIVPDSWIRL